MKSINSLHSGFVICCWATLAAFAQDLSIPSAWQNPTSNISLDSRQTLANGAATTLLSQIDPSEGPGTGLPRIPEDITSIYAVLSMQDFYNGNSTWNSTVTNGLQTYYNQYGLYGALPHFNNDATYMALAFFYAYRAYKQQSSLDLALSAGNYTYENAFITPSAAASGTGVGRNVSFAVPAGCTNATIAGGVFWGQTYQSYTGINMETLGPFMTLSAYLYEQTRNTVYQEAAQLSLDFIINHLLTGGIAYDTFTPNTCEKDTGLLTLNQAFFVEGLAVLANVTGNDTLTSLLETVVANVTTFPKWSSSNGVINEASDSDDANTVYKGWFIRGLAEARARFPDTDLARYIEAYITVQHNSLVDQALAPGTNFYAASWSGPSNASFSVLGNIAALDVLNAGISLPAPNTTSTANNSPGSPTATSKDTRSTGRSLNLGAIVGGVVGGLFVFAISTAAFLIRRRGRRQSPKERSASATNRTDIEPFLHQQTHAPVAFSKRRHLNATTQDGTAAIAPVYASGSESTVGDTSAPDGEMELNLVAGLPSLVRRLDNLLRTHEGELPPRYEG